MSLQEKLIENNRLIDIQEKFLVSIRERELNKMINCYSEGFLAEIGWAFISLIRLEDANNKILEEMEK